MPTGARSSAGDSSDGKGRAAGAPRPGFVTYRAVPCPAAPVGPTAGRAARATPRTEAPHPDHRAAPPRAPSPRPLPTASADGVAGEATPGPGPAGRIGERLIPVVSATCAAARARRAAGDGLAPDDPTGPPEEPLGAVPAPGTDPLAQRRSLVRGDRPPPGAPEPASGPASATGAGRGAALRLATPPGGCSARGVDRGGGPAVGSPAPDPARGLRAYAPGAVPPGPLGQSPSPNCTRARAPAGLRRRPAPGRRARRRLRRRWGGLVDADPGQRAAAEPAAPLVPRTPSQPGAASRDGCRGGRAGGPVETARGGDRPEAHRPGGPLVPLPSRPAPGAPGR